MLSPQHRSWHKSKNDADMPLARSVGSPTRPQGDSSTSFRYVDVRCLTCPVVKVYCSGHFTLDGPSALSADPDGDGDHEIASRALAFAASIKWVLHAAASADRGHHFPSRHRALMTFRAMLS